MLCILQIFLHKNDKDEFRTAAEVLLKHADNSLVFVKFPWELGVALNSFCQDLHNQCFGFGVYKMSAGGPADDQVVYWLTSVLLLRGRS